MRQWVFWLNRVFGYPFIFLIIHKILIKKFLQEFFLQKYLKLCSAKFIFFKNYGRRGLSAYELEKSAWTPWWWKGKGGRPWDGEGSLPLPCVHNFFTKKKLALVFFLYKSYHIFLFNVNSTNTFMLPFYFYFFYLKRW